MRACRHAGRHPPPEVCRAVARSAIFARHAVGRNIPRARPNPCVRSRLIRAANVGRYCLVRLARQRDRRYRRTQVGDGSGELKSMRTHPNHLRKGVAALLLEHIVTEAKARGLTRLSLETGSGPTFDPALALYRKRGFADGKAFSDYYRSAFNQFLHLSL